MLTCDEYFVRYKTCQHCMAARSFLYAQCAGWLYEGVLEDLREHDTEEREFYGIALARVVVGMSRRWRKYQSDALIPVERIRLWVDNACANAKRHELPDALLA